MPTPHKLFGGQQLHSGFASQRSAANFLQSIDRAHHSLKSGRLEISHGELLGANINRSPTSYLRNPAEERARYKHDIDKDMTLLKLTEGDESR